MLLLPERFREQVKNKTMNCKKCKKDFTEEGETAHIKETEICCECCIEEHDAK